MFSKNIKDLNNLENICHANDEDKLEQIKTIFRYKRRYQANFIHKVLKFIPNCLWKYRGIQKKKIMYWEGEDAYLKDLDWVNIVKSLRELRALSRIILSHHQRQILAFESESVLPCHSSLKNKDPELIHIDVPLEYSPKLHHSEYLSQVSKFIDQLPPLTEIDTKVLKEVSPEPINLESVHPKPKKK